MVWYGGSKVCKYEDSLLLDNGWDTSHTVVISRCADCGIMGRMT